MTMPVITGLTDQILIKLFHTDWSDKMIAEEYGISVQAVSKRRTKLGLIRRPVSRQVNEWLRARWPDMVSTKGSDSHHNDHSAQRLREFLRLQLGDKTLSDRQVALVQAWAEERRKKDDVLCYDPDQGWSYRPREKRDGNLVIDWPRDLNFPDEKFRKALELPPETDK
jgi:predicted transcriptional regulator